MTSRSPDLAELLDLALESLQKRLHTAIPGRIESYDSATQTVSVQPMVNESFVTDEGEEVTERVPIVQDVPVLFPRGGGFFITWPLQAGDFCQLLVNERSIDLYAEGDGSNPVDPVVLHRHDLTDAVAIPGFYPAGNPISDIADDRMVIGRDETKARIEILEDAVEVTVAGGATIRLEDKDGNAKMTVGDGAVSVAIANHLQTLYTNLKTIFDAHIHPTGVGPSGPTATPAPPWATNISSTKVTIPDG